MIHYTATLAHDPSAVLYYSFDWVNWLRTGDTLASCAVSVAEGTATIAASATGGSPSTSASATISGTVATIAVRSASAGRVALRWRAVSADGETDDRTTYLAVGDL